MYIVLLISNNKYMKKISAILALPLMMLFFVSCEDDNPVDNSNFEAGYEIVKMVSEQNNLSMLPVDMAFKFNILLAEWAAQPEKELSDLQETVGPYMNEYFKSPEIEIKEAGVYNINYSLDYFEGARFNGTVIIDTGNKRLDELSAGESWNISLTPAEHTIFTLRVYSHVYNREMVLSLDTKNTSYSISGSEESSDRWDITFSGVKMSNNSEYGSDWSGSFTLCKAGLPGFTYEECHNSTFKMWGGASGMTHHGWNMEYIVDETTALEYIPSCGLGGFMSGTVNAAFAKAQPVDNNKYKSREAVYRAERVGECGRTRTLEYMGRTYIVDRQ